MNAAKVSLLLAFCLPLSCWAAPRKAAPAAKPRAAAKEKPAPAAEAAPPAAAEAAEPKTPPPFPLSPGPEIPGPVRPVRTGNMTAKARVKGIATAQDTYEIYAEFDGRVEEIFVDLFDLANRETLLAKLAQADMAAMLDYTTDENREQMEKRWKGVFNYIELKPEFQGVVTNIYVKPRQRVAKGDRMFTIARKIVVIAKNTEPIYGTLAPGMKASVAYVKDDSVRLEAGLASFIPVKDAPYQYRLWLEATRLREKVRVGGHFEGDLLLGEAKNARLVPRRSLVERNGRHYLLMEVNVGLKNAEDAELLAPGDSFIYPEPQEPEEEK